MKKAIFDASFFLSFLLPDEQSAINQIQEFIEGKLILIEPFIFNLEVINGLRYAFKSKRIPAKKLLKVISYFQKLKNINYIYDFDWKKLVEISLDKDVSVYDACYLYIQSKTGLKLFSLDKKLKD